MQESQTLSENLGPVRHVSCGSGDQFSLASFRGIVRRWQTDRQTGCQNSKLAKSWNCLVRGALACSTSSPSSWLLHTGLHCCAVLCAVLCAAAAGCAAGGVGGKVKVGGWSASLLPAFTAINLIIVIILVTVLLQSLDLVPREQNRIDTYKLRLGGVSPSFQALLFRKS